MDSCKYRKLEAFLTLLKLLETWGGGVAGPSAAGGGGEHDNGY